MNGTDCVIVCTTLPSGADGAALARTLVGERLAACASILPGVRSLYRWKDEIEEDDEQQVLIKTTADRAGALSDRIRELHPYDVPELLVLPVAGGGGDYLDWVRASTAGSQGRAPRAGNPQQPPSTANPASSSSTKSSVASSK